jgi:hypothetical protein
MVVILIFISKQASIVERFLVILHVNEMASISLKASLDELFCKHGLSFSHLRG